METNGKIERDASSERSWFAAEALAIFEAPEFTARGRAAAIVQRIQAMEIAPEHEAAVATLVRDFVGLLKEAGARAFISDELIAREAEKLSTAVRFGGFAHVAAVDEVTRCFPALIRFYSGGEIDIIRNLCHGKTKIEDGFDAEHIIIGGRLYTRHSLREAGRPQSFTNVERWHSQFPAVEGNKKTA